MTKRLWLTGYRSYELRIFKPDDPKLKVIDYVLRTLLSQFVESGCRWLLTGGQLGVEQWSVAAAKRLQKRGFAFKVAVVLPFRNLGQRWQHDNQLRLFRAVHQADFSGYLSDAYYSPVQFRYYQRFMLEHTDGALLIYDPDYPGFAKYDYRAIQKYREQHRYQLVLVDMDDLQEIADEYEVRYHRKHHHGLN